MLLPWMMYAAASAALLALAALPAEHLLAWTGLPRRLAWAGSAVLSLAFAAGAWLWPAAPSLPATTLEGARPAAGLAPVAAVAAAPLELSPASSLVELLPGLWLALSAGALAGIAIGWARLRRERRRWRPGVVEGTPVLLSDVTGPAVVGMLRPEIVLPRWALSLPAEERGLVLAHEEEHRRAGDPALTAGLLLLAALMPWNLALWWQLRRLRLAVEVDCDARVLRRCPDRALYGSLLLSVGARARALPVAAPALSEPRTFLETRIRAMTAPKPSWVALRAAGLLIAAGGLFVLACETPRPTEVPDAGPAPRAVATPGIASLHTHAGARAVLESRHPELLTRGSGGRTALVWMLADTAGAVLDTRLGYTEHAWDGGFMRFKREQLTRGGARWRRTGDRVFRAGELGPDPIVVLYGVAAGDIELIEVLPAPASGDDAAPGRMTGMVMDAETGRPLAGVEVFVEGSRRGTITQMNGRFFVLNVPSGRHTVTARLDGYATVRREGVQITSDGMRTIDFQLPRER